MKILRAHSYGLVEAVRNELDVLPARWRECIANVPWVLLPDEMSPLWIGLMAEESTTHDGRKYSKIKAWYCPSVTSKNWRHQPHIYLKSRWSAIHEAAHAIDEVTHAPTVELFEPEKALYPYMASNKCEFFACAVAAFLRHPDDERWNIDDLNKSGAKIYDYLRTQLL